MPNPEVKLPRGLELQALLGTADAEFVEELVGRALLAPIAEFLGRPGKQIRGHFVEIGFELAGRFGSRSPSGEEADLCAKGATLLELLHAGSLVVDDIQDGSAERRGQPTLHRSHGLNIALNAGNWLYFWPLQMLSRWGLEPAREVKIHQLCHRALLRAHFGQALDVGVPVDSIPRARVREVCLASLELKTGALMALGISIGAALGGADDTRLQLLETFGHGFGVALQMYDDIGNLNARGGAPDPKQYEDLRLRRPSWVWAVAAGFSDEEFEAFRAAVSKLPDDGALTAWMSGCDFANRAKGMARAHLEGCVEKLTKAMEAQGEFEPTLHEIVETAERLTKAYE